MVAQWDSVESVTMTHRLSTRHNCCIMVACRTLGWCERFTMATGCQGDTVAACWWHVARWDGVADATLGHQLSRRHRCGMMVAGRTVKWCKTCFNGAPIARRHDCGKVGWWLKCTVSILTSRHQSTNRG